MSVSVLLDCEITQVSNNKYKALTDCPVLVHYEITQVSNLSHDAQLYIQVLMQDGIT